MARKLQDPLANISAVMTDNDVLFKTGIEGADETSYSVQIQPVQAFSFDEAGFNLIARAVVPILGLAPTAQKPPGIDQPLPPSEALTWGLSDITTQFFFSPKSTSALEVGRRADDLLAQPHHFRSGRSGMGRRPSGCAGRWFRRERFVRFDHRPTMELRRRLLDNVAAPDGDV